MPGTTSRSPSGSSETVPDAMPTAPTATRVVARVALAVASALGVLYAAVSAYWGSGGHALLSTIGGTLEREGRAGSAGLLAIVWVTVALKLVAVLAGLAAVAWHGSLGPRRRLMARRVAWAAAVILTVYGGVLTITGLLVQTGAIHAAAQADHRALRWHALVWDPWFLVWGLALVVALTCSRTPASGVRGPRARASGLMGPRTRASAARRG